MNKLLVIVLVLVFSSVFMFATESGHQAQNFIELREKANELLYERLSSRPIPETAIPNHHERIRAPRPADESQLSDNIDSFIERFNAWHAIWESQNIREYLPFYTSDFFSRTSNQDKAAWTAHKTRVFRRNQNVEIKIVFSDFTHFWNGDLIYVEVAQDYSAGAFQDFGRKTMLWEMRDSQWVIVAEDWFAMQRPVVPELPEPPIIPVEPEMPPIVIEIPQPDTLRPKWEARAGQVPYEFINFLFPMPQNYGEILIIVEKKYQHAATFRFSEDLREITLLEAYPISTGQAQGNKMVRGDLKTPEGLYVTIRFRSEAELLASYGRDALQFGTGAWVLNYPNQLDRLRRKTGSGIWIHGSDRALTPFDTEGCIRFDNDIIDYFREELNLGRTPVIINDVLEWTDVIALDKEVENIHAFLRDWEDSWRNQDVERYLSFYCSDEFITRRQRMDYQAWEQHKRRVFNAERPVTITLFDFYYHYADHLLLVSFYQDYAAGTFNSFGRKQLVLRRKPDSWVIIQEEWTGAPKRATHRSIVQNQRNTGFVNEN